MSDAAPRRRGRAGDHAAGWGALFQQSTEPIFLLNRRRRLRFVNHAWEALTGRTADSVFGLSCLPRTQRGERLDQALAQALAPPPEVLAGGALSVRRPVPPAQLGPPWWDIHFLPLRDANGVLAILGRITAVGASSEKVPTATAGFTEALAGLRQRTAARCGFELFASAAAGMARALAQARAAAQTRSPVWIIGEPGSGKETLARVIHFQGVTREQTFLAVDCAGLQPYLIRNMLFGHAGLATGSRLGTIYLKEPSALPRDLQAELLDWLAEQDEPPRLIAGCGADPLREMQAGRIAEEVIAAWAVLEIRLPPLRERRADLPRLMESLAPIGAPPLTAPVRDLLQAYDWPGNCRELRSVLIEACRAADGKPVEVAHVPLALRRKVGQAQAVQDRPGTSGETTLLLGPMLEQVERNLIRLALKRAKGNKSEAAELLGVGRTQLWRRIRELKLEE
jgi:transcriptional regulator with PAS, ATPase and Fis domain